jgi:hypothetical protein
MIAYNGARIIHDNEVDRRSHKQSAHRDGHPLVSPKYPTRLNDNLNSSSATQDQRMLALSKWRIRDHIQDTQCNNNHKQDCSERPLQVNQQHNIKIASWPLVVVQEQTEIPTRHLFTATTTIHFSWPLVNSIIPESLREKMPHQ